MKTILMLGLVLMGGCAHVDEDRTGPEGHASLKEHRYGAFYRSTTIRNDGMTRYAQCLNERTTQIARTGIRSEDVQAVCYCETTARSPMELQACGIGLRVAVGGSWGVPTYGTVWMASRTPTVPSSAQTETPGKDEKKLATTAQLKEVAQLAAGTASDHDKLLKAFNKLKAAYEAAKKNGGTP